MKYPPISNELMLCISDKVMSDILNLENKGNTERWKKSTISFDDLMCTARDNGLAPNYKSEEEKRRERWDRIYKIAFGSKPLLICPVQSIVQICP